MPTLYHCTDARSFRPLWALEEIGLDYELKVLPFPPRVFAKPYLALNPLGTIPLFIDGETRMTGSAAICEYLAQRHPAAGLAVRPDQAAYGAYLNWLHSSDATLTFPQTLVLRYGRMEPPERRLPQAVDDYAKWFLGRLRGVDAVVSKADYIAAGRFTAADIAVGYALLLASALGLDLRFPPAVVDYWARLRSREGFRKAVDRQEQAARDQNVPHAPLTPIFTNGPTVLPT